MWKDTFYLTNSWAEDRFISTDTIPPFGYLEVCLLNLLTACKWQGHSLIPLLVPFLLQSSTPQHTPNTSE